MSKHLSACLSLVALAVMLASCARLTSATAELKMPDRVAVPEPGLPAELSPAPTSGDTAPLDESAAGRAVAQVVRGTGSFVGRAPASTVPATTTADDGISMNFVNADVADVAKTVLGDYLKVNYVIDAAVQGAITLQTSEPLRRDAVMPALEQSLRLAGLAIVTKGGLYRIVPLAEATRQNGTVFPTAAARLPGYGIEVVPLQFVGAQEMQHVLEPMAPNSAILRADPARNLLIVAGTAQERQAILDNVRLFDVNWMAGMSFALLPLKSADAKSIVAELNQVTGGKDGPLGGVVRLTPIERMNAVLAISPQPKYLDELRGWIDRLDRAQQSTEQRIFVYYVQNGRASDLANALTKVLYGTSSGNGGSSSGKETADGSGVPQALINQLSPPGSGSTPQLPAFQDPAKSGSGGGPAASEGPSDNFGGDTGGSRSSPRMHITADERNNALVILAVPHDYELIESALNKLDLPPLQVLLEAAVAEVTLTNDLKYGVQYFFKSGSSHQITNSNNAVGSIAASFPGFNYAFTNGNNIKAVLNALEDVTRVDVLSSPQILVLNNQTASLQVGDQVPIATQESTSTTTSDAPIVNSIQYHDTGVILKVTPHVNESGLVQMDVSQEVSDVGATTTSSLNSPTIQQRKINSTVAVQDGETVALGGLIKDSRTKERSGIPILQDLPVIGNLFGTTSNQGTRTELLVMITPHVVQGVQRLRTVTDEMRRKLSATLPLLPITR